MWMRNHGSSNSPATSTFHNTFVNLSTAPYSDQGNKNFKFGIAGTTLTPDFATGSNSISIGRRLSESKETMPDKASNPSEAETPDTVINPLPYHPFTVLDSTLLSHTASLLPHDVNDLWDFNFNLDTHGLSNNNPEPHWTQDAHPILNEFLSALDDFDVRANSSSSTYLIEALGKNDSANGNIKGLKRSSKVRAEEVTLEDFIKMFIARASFRLI
ncbi:hypothetical protein EJ08DRAFT_340862 [Tothia fuscella]|uniref:Uncharacterized protein n=1 Tax=Tothia fuscella TaxID=1048955 RepID=A0A9P4U409_9PEZI|nr:hypothetical protein EJ08DRAFT_340862 [Tothia fuscella]